MRLRLFCRRSAALVGLSMSITDLCLTDALKGDIVGAVLMSGGGLIPRLTGPRRAAQTAKFWQRVRDRAGAKTEADMDLNALFAFHPVGETAGIGELELVFRDIVLKAPRRAVILPVDIRRKAGVALNGLVGCPVQKEKRTGRDSRRKQNELDELFGQRAVKDFIQSDSPFPRPS